jgi:hypothetical protein
VVVESVVVLFHGARHAVELPREEAVHALRAGSGPGQEVRPPGAQPKRVLIISSTVHIEKGRKKIRSI